MATYLYVECLEDIQEYSMPGSGRLNGWKKGTILRIDSNTIGDGEDQTTWNSSYLPTNIELQSYFTYVDGSNRYFRNSITKTFGWCKSNDSGLRIKPICIGSENFDKLFLSTSKSSQYRFVFSRNTPKYKDINGTMSGYYYQKNSSVDVEVKSDGSYEYSYRDNENKCTNYYIKQKNSIYWILVRTEFDGFGTKVSGILLKPSAEVTDIGNSEQQKASNKEDDKTTKAINQYTLFDQETTTFPVRTSMTINSNGSTDGALAAADAYTPRIDELISVYDKDVKASNLEDNYFFDISSVLGIFGLPYQFMPHVDPRIDISTDKNSEAIQGMGSDYADKIISNIPLLLISPGKPAFMAGYSTDESKSAIEKFMQNIAGNAKIDDLVSKNGKFYTFEYAVPEYYSYVNPMCRITARLLNIHTDEYQIVTGTSNDKLNWLELTRKQIKGLTSYIGDYLAIPFYIDSDTQISENLSNDTTESSLANTIDSFSDAGKELMYYLGYSSAILNTDSIVEGDLYDNTQNLNDFISSITSGGNIFNSLKNQITAVATGGRLEFPKIWSNSSFSRSYDVTIKLRSPDCDNLSLWTNIIVPLCHIYGLVQPRMIADNPNAHTSPFIVRAMYKGFFNVDMGIITSCNITKGDDAQWTINGIPTSVDVSLTITDLYDVMSMTAAGTDNLKFDTLDNTAQMDLLMNMCGINIYKPEIGRLIDIWYTLNVETRATDAFRLNLFGSIRQNISSNITKIYRGL